MTNKKLNFEVGDEVVDIFYIDLWDNVMHPASFINGLKNRKTVVMADETRFSIEPVSSLFSSEYKDEKYIYFQNNGEGRGFGRLFNITKNGEKLLAFMRNKYETRIAECTKADEKAIADLEAEIKFKQEQIEAIKAGKRPISFKRDAIERDFLKSQLEQIEKHLA